MSWDVTPPAAFESEEAWEQWAEGQGVEWPSQEGEQMQDGIITRESRRGGWDALATLEGMTFSGHGATREEALLDLQDQLSAFLALQAEATP